jgi:hypothetical protein
MNTQLIKLAVKGNFGFPTLELFKKRILEKVRDVRVLKDRLYEPGEVEFELEATRPAKTIAASLESGVFSDFKLKVLDIGTSDISVRVEPVRTQPKVEGF